MLTLKEYAELQEKSPLEVAGIKIGKALHRKEYEAALELMFLKNVNAADAAKRFKHVDARELQKMFANLSESDMTNEACWKNYKQIGMKTKNGKEVPNCVPKEEKEEDVEEAKETRQHTNADIDARIKKRELRQKHQANKLAAKKARSNHKFAWKKGELPEEVELEEGWKINKNTYFMGKDVGPVHSHDSGYTIAKISGKWIVSNPDDEKSGEFPSLAKAKSQVADLTESVELDEARYDKFGDRKDGKTRASVFRAKELKHELRNEKPSKTKKAEEPKSKYTPKNRHQRDMFEGTDFKAGDTVIDTNTKMKGVVQHKGNKDEIYVKFGSINKAIKASELRLSEEVTEEVAATSVAGGGVDMNPTGYSKRDKRKRSDTDQMYRRNLGLKAIKEILKRKEQ